MRTFSYKTKTIEEKQFETVTCDICKKEYVRGDDVLEIQEFFNIRSTGGYGAIIGDESTLEIDICQHYFISMLKEKVNLDDYIKD